MHNIFQSLRTKLAHTLETLVDLVFPRPQSVLQIEKMTADEFVEGRMNTKPLPNTEITALLSYEDALVKEAVWQLKYKKNQKVAELCAEILYRVIHKRVMRTQNQETVAPDEKILITSIPLSKRRLNERGYVQIDLVLKKMTQKFPELQEYAEIRKDLLAKTRHTSTQTKLDRTERIKNLKGCFQVLNPEKIQNKEILLVDDVVTTGSTIEEARSTLLQAGVRKVTGISLAH